MDQMEMVHVHVIQVIQHLRVQLIIVLFVLMVMFCKVQFVTNALKLVELVNSIQLIALRIVFFFFIILISFLLIFFDFHLDVNQDMYFKQITHVHQIVEMELTLTQAVVLVCFFILLFSFFIIFFSSK